MKYLIEIATTDFATTQSAAKGGADRIELCSALSEGGITPSRSLVRQCRERFSLPLFPIIRPRSGDFLYSDDEFSIMKQDVLLCKELGCDGIVTGMLEKDGSIDRRRTALLRELAYPMEATFHRAFDRCRDPFKAMEELIELGYQRILTSGQQRTAAEALPMIRQLVAAANNCITIMPGSGIHAGNIKQVAAATGATEFHASLSTTVTSRMEFVHPAFAATGDYLLAAIESQSVINLKRALL